MRLPLEGFSIELPVEVDLENPLCGDSRLEVETLERVVMRALSVDTSEGDFVEVPACERLPEEGFGMELPLEEGLELELLRD